MKKHQTSITLAERLRESLYDEKEISFAYLYGSAVYDPTLSGGDIDVAVYLKPSNMRDYIKREAELTALLIRQLAADEIDLRILNALPLVLQYTILKEGTLILSRDEIQRTEFETSVMIRFFELKPYLDEYRLMLSQRIRGVQ
jgi:predicted nucleotidyltransferase